MNKVLKVLGFALMLAGAIMMFFRLYVVVEDTIYINIIKQIDILVYRSISLGLFALGFVAYLASKEFKG